MRASNIYDLLLPRTDRLYDRAEHIFHHKRFHRIVANALIIIFLLGLGLSEAVRQHWIDPGEYVHSLHNHYFAIKLAFTCLLIFELLSLVFVLPKSVANSVGKQFELFSLILLRSAFKEFEKLPEPINWNGWNEPVIHIIAYVIGAGLLFLGLAFYYRIQKHTRLTENDYDRNQFVSFKKLLALLLLLVFLGLGIYDLVDFWRSGGYHNSFNTYFTALIFVDILIVLLSLRYTSAFHKVFRYSAFVLLTIFLRIALTASPWVEIGLGLFSMLYAIGLTVVYNFYDRE